MNRAYGIERNDELLIMSRK